MQISGAMLGTFAAAGAIGGGITAYQTKWRAPVPPVMGSAEIGIDMLLGAAPGMALLTAGVALGARGGTLGAIGGAMQVLGVAASGFGFAAGTVGYFNWNR